MPGDSLRKPFLVAAVLVVLVAFLACLGSSLVTKPPPFADRVSQTLSSPQTKALLDQFEISSDDARDSLNGTKPDNPPGLGIPALALVEGLLLLVLVITAAPLLIGERVTGMLTGALSIIGGLVVLLAGIATAIISFTALLLMVGLLLAVPFGTLAYLAIFGSFDTSGAAVFTSLVLGLTLACIVLLMLAQQRFLKGKGLMLLLATAALLTFVTALLHSLVPGFLVSITDALAALVTAIVSAVWALLVIIWGLVAAVRVLRLGRQGGGGALTREAPTSTDSPRRSRP
ncbi:MAG TPA: hypothetical protein VLS51_09580 [Propionibacteriaceae bacterium]|nr:hypothetical protein [Propionibacteriaceae bacterium]